MSVPMLCSGQFLVGTTDSVHVAWIEECRVALYYDSLNIAETRCRNPEQYATQIVREFFGRDALFVLPAPTFEALAFYLEHYEGRLQDRVRQMAAVLLSGTLFQGGEDNQGGARVPAPVPMDSPPAPNGAAFDLTAVNSLEEVA